MSPTTHAAVTHLLVGNPTAQSGKNAARIGTATRLLDEAGIACEVLHTAPGGKTIDLVHDAIDRHPYRCVISMGGDGTFREVASGLLRSRRRDEVALAMLPTGTANDQGRSFGLEASEDALARNVLVVAGGHETRLDAGEIEAVDDHGVAVHRAHFFDSAGWGLSARILAERNDDRKIVEQIPGLRHVYRDQLVYAGAMVKSLLGSYVVSDKFEAVVVADGAVHHLERLSDLVVKATRVYGGQWVFDPSSRHDDGLFEVVPARGRRDWATRVLAAHQQMPLPGQALDALGIEPSEVFCAARLDLSFHVARHRTPLAAQIDGEEFPATRRARISVLPRALRLIVPRGEG